MSQTLDLTYPAILDTIKGRDMTEKEQSRQLLYWFLQTFYYLEETEAAECICDDNYDKGIDAIYVDPHLKRIDVFSASIGTKVSSDRPQWTQESDIKKLEASLRQFRDGDAVRQLALDTTNTDLKRILTTQPIAECIDDKKYSVHGVYVTNRTNEVQTQQFLQHTSSITVWDASELMAKYVSPSKLPPVGTPISFDISDVPYMEYPFNDSMTMTVVPLPAAELVKMDGIENNRLFAPNVRFWLGKNTPVNQALAESISNDAEHALFPAFHNGIIVLAENVKCEDGKLTISNYGVANGCQSLRGLYENRSQITPNLRILTKLFNVSPDSELGQKITNRTNNQNGTRNRDFQSRSDRQQALQAEVHAKYPGEFQYRIARGERPDWDQDKVIENELAGKILLSFDRKRPADCSLDIFTEERHTDIFQRPEVNAERIVILFELLRIGNAERRTMKNKLVAKYPRTKFFLLYLTRLALQEDTEGKFFIDDPRPYLELKKGRERLKYCFTGVTKSLVRIFGRHVDRKNETGYFDYKTDLKNPELLQELSAKLLDSYDAITDNEYDPSFSKLWKASELKV